MTKNCNRDFSINDLIYDFNFYLNILKMNFHLLKPTAAFPVCHILIFEWVKNFSFPAFHVPERVPVSLL